MERLTDRVRAQKLKDNADKLKAAGFAVSPDHELYIRLAEYENAEEEKRVYLCDPDKRSKCNNSPWCFENGGECRYTQYKEYAMIDENGNAIVCGGI